MSKTAPAIPLFGDAYLADTHHLSLEEHGAYLKLMMIAWRIDGCQLPDDDIRIARMLSITTGKWGKLKPAVMAFWTLENGFWKQGRLTKERKFVEEKRSKNSANSKARWDSQVSENKGFDESDRISERNAPPPPPTILVESNDSPNNAREENPAPEIDQAARDWNALASQKGWPVITKLSDTRRKHLKDRLADANGLDGWRAALRKASASPLLSQAPPPTWFAFDWLTKPTNFQKLIEGNYDRGFGSRNGNGSDHQPDNWSAVLREIACGSNHGDSGFFDDGGGSEGLAPVGFLSTGQAYSGNG